MFVYSLGGIDVKDVISYTRFYSSKADIDVV